MPMPSYMRTAPAKATVLTGDCRKVLYTLPANSVDAVVTDPPYELGFMGKKWDGTGVAFDPETWCTVLRVLRPGGYMLTMGGSRTYHCLACAVEDAGFEIRDCLMWIYGSGFPKGQGCLKPAYEPILLARRPGNKVLPLGIDGCRVPTGERPAKTGGMARKASPVDGAFAGLEEKNGETTELGRWPANILHDGSDEVMEAFAAFGESKSKPGMRGERHGSVYGGGKGPEGPNGLRGHEDSGTAARFFYCAKASRRERNAGLEELKTHGKQGSRPNSKDLTGKFPDHDHRERGGNNHPTVKPLALMRWMVRLVAPQGGHVLDPFGGSGTTALAALAEGLAVTLIEENAEYVEIINKRLAERGA